MSGNPAEQPQNQAEERAQKMRAEFDWLMHLVMERVKELNANRGDLPEIVMRGSILQLGPFELHLEFDQGLFDPTKYALVIKVGVPLPKRMFGFDRPTIRYLLQPTASRNPGDIVWTNTKENSAPFTTEELAQFAVGTLIAYYREHMPK